MFGDDDDDGDDLPARPRTRGECKMGVRPCPWVGCRHHLYLNVTDAGNIHLHFPGIEPDEMVESCSLDAADRGGATLEEVGNALNLTRERIRQIEVGGLFKLYKISQRRGSRIHPPVDVGGQSALAAAQG